MNRRTHLLAALLCALLMGVASAQDTPTPPDGQPPAGGPGAQGPGSQGPGGPRRGGMGGPGFGFRMPPFPLLEALDADKDGKLSKEEIDGAVAALQKLDKDGDGKLSKDEIGWPPAGIGRGGPGMGFMNEMGRRGGMGGGPGGFGGGPGRGADDGPVVSFVDRIMNNDKDRDGKVTKEELPERMQWMVQRLDTNQDGAIDKSEAEAAAAPRARRGGAGPGAKPGGAQPKDPPANPDGK